ncbi:LacI family DNA-binding transcriptional regulator [Chitinimonas sp.]|uniref:LacI family DNA-binding transcriptional regulator n=1 Tax=Chitinimonas sp. TaxID=1934313 RepID=UPI002F941651
MATIKDVAKLAGVGVGTVSRVLSGKGAVSARATDKVRSAIAELDFRPSHIGRALSARSLGTIGVFVPDFGGAYYGPILRVLDTELRKVDRHMVAVNGCGHGGPHEEALEGVDFLIQRQCDGILVFSHEISDAELGEFKRRQPNLAVVNREVPLLEEGCFFMDHRGGGRLAARALLEHGHRKLAVIAGPDRATDNRERLEGFYAELAEQGIARESVLHVTGDFSMPSGWQCAQQLLAMDKPFTGLFAANDEMALAAISCLQGVGLQVPGDISVVGYDDIDMAAYASPRLSTIHAPLPELVQGSLNWLLNRCYGMNLPVERSFELSLRMRDSVARLPC